MDEEISHKMKQKLKKSMMETVLSNQNNFQTSDNNQHQKRVVEESKESS